MKGYLKTIALSGTILGMLMALSFAEVADAAGRGNGQVLRDGSGSFSSTRYQGKGQRGDCQLYGTYPNNASGRYGDGTRPRPQDGTGFGAKR
ncbi:MAG: hypothetical protein SNJ53_02885 [Thermodesulfovibrionales bacterium]